MSDKFDEESLFAQQKKQAERTMKIVIGVFVVVILGSLYFLVFDN